MKRHGTPPLARLVQILLPLFAAVALVAAFNIYSSPSAQSSFRIAEVTVNGTGYNVYVAGTPTQQAQGLMNRSSIGDCGRYGNCLGMFFVFANDTSQCFWMKNTQIPLEQYWIENGVVANEASGMPYSLNVTCHSGEWVLETAPNAGVAVGQRVSLLRYLT